MNKKSIYNINAADKDITHALIKELEKGLNFINHEDVVTFFGSARITPDNRIYQNAVDIAKMISSNAMSVMTGGGPGIMEAANKGATLGTSRSYGINVVLPHEQHMNPYVTHPFVCEYLFSRKVLLMKNAKAFIIMDGGYGTLDELFEILTLISVGDIATRPIILFGTEFWAGIRKWIEMQMLEKGYIDQSLHDSVILTDKISDVERIIFTDK